LLGTKKNRGGGDQTSANPTGAKLLKRGTKKKKKEKKNTGS